MKPLIFMAAILTTLCLLSSSAFSQDTRAYTMTNKTGMIITGVSISPNDANSWGLNLNSKATVLKDESFDFKQSVDKNNCIYDIRFTGEDGKQYFLQDVDLCQNTAISLVVTKTDTKTDNNMKTDSDTKTDTDKKSDDPSKK